jgi:ATP synthase protein I
LSGNTDKNPIAKSIIQKMCQAGFMAFAALLGVVVVLQDVFQGEQGIRSLALGIALWLLPNCYFVFKVMRRLGCALGRDLLNIFYRAELIKLFFSGIFFIMVIKLLSVNIPILLLAYLASQLVFWLLLIIKSKEGLL